MRSGSCPPDRLYGADRAISACNRLVKRPAAICRSGFVNAVRLIKCPETFCDNPEYAMLTTIIYRSHLCDEIPVSVLPEMVDKASRLNARHQVMGILLFNGTHFFQILEGPEEGVVEIYARICADPRHHNVVELMRDYSPGRRFGKHGMELFDLRLHDGGDLLPVD